MSTSQEPTKTEVDSILKRLRSLSANKVSHFLFIILIYALLFCTNFDSRLVTVLLRLWRQKPHLVVDYLWNIYLHRLLRHASLTRRAHLVCQINAVGHQLDVDSIALDAMWRQCECCKKICKKKFIFFPPLLI